MNWAVISGVIEAIELVGCCLLVAYIMLLLRQQGQQAKKLAPYQKLGVIVQDYLRAREYTEKTRMGEAGKIYENVLRKAMEDVLDEIHKPQESK